MEEPTQSELEQRLREKTQSEERFRLVAPLIDEAFWMASADERTIYYVSPAYETVIGRSCDSLYADPTSWIESLHPEDRLHVRNATGPHDGEYRISKADGPRRPTSAARPIVCST